MTAPDNMRTTREGKWLFREADSQRLARATTAMKEEFADRAPCGCEPVVR